ncbi:DUF5682 family protein [Streptomyces sp. NPDC004647]|uniref:DUF5682 family protein n=1 Tax=Streptomyces sp. NPDC004647 TaxID=3154671 RepID=UPI0033A3E3CA
MSGQGQPLLLGVRHHGPGSARAVRDALEQRRPRAVLIEGPPEADALVSLAADEGMRPPVALLAHVADAPGRAAFWPLAEFSPEWVAIRWALAHDVPVRFIDLPAALTLALSDDDDGGGSPGRPDQLDRPARRDGRPDPMAAPAPGTGPDAPGMGGLPSPGRLPGAPGPSEVPGVGGAGVPGPSGVPGPGGLAGSSAAPGAGDPAPGDSPRSGGVPGSGGLPAVGVSGPSGVPGVGDPPGSGGVPCSGAGGLAGPGGAPGAGHPVPGGVLGPGGAPESGSGASAEDGAGERLRIDPLGVLAEAAGYDDPERWWEDVVEHRMPGRPADRTRGVVNSSTVAARHRLGRADGDSAVVSCTGTGAGGGGAVGQGDTRGKPTAQQDAVSGGTAPTAPTAPGSAGSTPVQTESEGSAGPAGHGEEALAAFEALAEAMGALRETYGDGGHERDAVREAHMRLRMRDARREFGDEFAVVCGAWHVPALTRRTTATADRQLLKALPKAKVELTWVPWTHRRLSRHSGYGAGIASPGWYGHLFHAADRPIERWMTKVAGLLRDEGQPVSSAHVIEAVRLAETLATMRGRPLAGLVETTDAVRAVMCEGSDVPLALVQDRLVVGDVLGEVPDTAPAVPLQRDLTRVQRRLRLKPEALERELELDLRKDTDARRSLLLHRLRLLGVDWGEPVRSRDGLGTFRETWRLGWEPELSVRVAEAGVWGTTVHAAATVKAESQAVSAGSLVDVTALAEHCLLAGLPDALPVVMRVLADRAALDADVGHLAQALPSLVRSVRYGDVRGTDSAALAEVATGLAERVFVGLPPACVGLDADGAAEMRRHMDSVHSAVGLLAGSRAAEQDSQHGPHGPRDPQSFSSGTDAAELSGPLVSAAGMRERWAAVLRALARRDTVPGSIRGRAARLLLDDGRLAVDEAARYMGLALSPGTAPAESAAWIEGFVGGGRGGGMLLVHDERLLGLLDAWLTGVPADAFTDVLPLLRRTFAVYEPGVRRTLGELARRGPAAPGAAATGAAGAAAPGFGSGLDPERAAAVLPTLRLLLGHDDNDLAGVAG